MTPDQGEPYNHEMVWQRSLLILEDEQLVASLLANALESHGFTTGNRSSAVEAKKYVEQMDPDGVLIDINLGGGGQRAAVWRVVAPRAPRSGANLPDQHTRPQGVARRRPSAKRVV